MVKCAKGSGQSVDELLDDLERWLPRLREKAGLNPGAAVGSPDWLVADLVLGIIRPTFRRVFLEELP